MSKPSEFGKTIAARVWASDDDELPLFEWEQRIATCVDEECDGIRRSLGNLIVLASALPNLSKEEKQQIKHARTWYGRLTPREDTKAKAANG